MNTYINIQVVVQSYAVLISILFVIITFLDTGEILEVNKKQLQTTKEALDSSKLTNREMLNFLSSISSSSTGLVHNVNIISDTLSRLPDKINLVSNNLERLNKVTIKSTELAEKEYQKEAKIEFISVKCNNKIVKYLIQNVGDVIAYIDKVIVTFPIDCLIEPRLTIFHSSYAAESYETDTTRFYQWINFPSLIPKENLLFEIEMSYQEYHLPKISSYIKVTTEIVYHSLNQKGHIEPYTMDLCF